MALGPELISNVNFDQGWTPDGVALVPDGWNWGFYGHTAADYITESVAGNQCHLFNATFNASSLLLFNVVVIGTEYEVTINLESRVGTRLLRMSDSAVATYTAFEVGITTFRFTATGSSSQLNFHPDGDGDTEFVINSISLKEVLPDPPDTPSGGTSAYQGKPCCFKPSW